jgi:hypothetical protein
MSNYYYTKTEIYTEKTILEYDEFNNVISRNVYYDKEVKYNKQPPKIESKQPKIESKQQPKIVEDKYYSFKLLNNIPMNPSLSSSMPTSPNISPTSSMPTSPKDSVIIDMSNLFYSNTNYN